MSRLSASDQSAIANYLRKAASPDAKDLYAAMEFDACTAKKRLRVSVLPVYRESVECLNTLRIPEADDHLLIVVANRPQSDSDDNNHQWLEAWRQTLGLPSQGRPKQGFQFCRHAAAGDILWLDFASDRGLPDSGGVGLARKIGCDLATMLIANRCITSPWIHSLDADAQLPGDYFTHTDQAGDCSALTYPFQHIGDMDCPHHRATLVYEWHILRYALGLKRAGSRHAWVPLGSAMAIHAADYARVRGFPERAAGEDFYLLSKLSKVRPVRCLSAQPIRIQSRTSDRVPFGTGPAAQRISELADPLAWPSRHPAVFIELMKYNKNLMKSLGDKIYEHTLDQASRDALDRARAASPEAARQKRHLLAWFDAFRELKQVHQFRDRLHKDKPVRELVALDQHSDIDLSESHFQIDDWADLQRANTRMRSVLFDNRELGASVN